MVTIGAYDGVHRGHQTVIAEVKRLAEREGARAVVLTFDRHPATIVRPESAPQLLTSPEQRLELLAETGLDAHRRAALRRGPVEGVAGVVHRAGARSPASPCKVVVVGEDFHFGSHREGNVRLLEGYGADHDFVVDPVHLVARADGVEEPISSTAIRRALAGGDVELAARDARPPARGPRQGRASATSGAGCSGSRRPTSRCPTRCACPPTACTPAGTSDPTATLPPVRHQPRPAPDVLRARRPLAARGPPARLRRRPLRRAGQGPLRPLPAQRAQVRRHRRHQAPSSPTTSTTPATCSQLPRRSKLARLGGLAAPGGAGPPGQRST